METVISLAEKLKEAVSLGKKSVFVSEKHGNDTTGEGTQSKPYKTMDKYLSIFGEPDNNTMFFVDTEVETEKFMEIPKTRLKKIIKQYNLERQKAQKASKMSAEMEAQRERNIEEAKKIKVEMDASLPTPIQVKIRECKSHRNERIKVYGWVQSIRTQGKGLMFVTIRDGAGLLQCIMSDLLAQIYEAVVLSVESTVCVYGTLKEVPHGKTAPNQHELIADFWEIVQLAPSELPVNINSNPDTQLDQRHLLLRHKTYYQIMKVRSRLLQCFRDYYFDNAYTEITPPTLVQTQCEGGSTLFKFDYFGADAFLTQSSQLYLETVIPVLGDSFCIAQSYRAEQSKTRRHIAEYTHVEAERPFITFDDLLNTLEDLIVEVLTRLMKTPEAEMVLQLNPNFKVPQKPFVRMNYSDAIDYLRQHNITKDDGSMYEMGDDIPEAPERQMTDQIGKPILLCRFPADIKSFYISRCSENHTLTESVDLLVPGVGEVIGGSMRIWDYKELDDAYKHEGIDPSPYYWYTDQRNYGSCPHGGYGLGLERMLTWILDRYHIRDVCLYPRFVGRCTP